MAELAIDGESRSLTALGLGLDWRSRDTVLSADAGWQNDQLNGARPSVTPAANFIPAVPDNQSQLRPALDLFGCQKPVCDGAR